MTTLQQRTVFPHLAARRRGAGRGAAAAGARASRAAPRWPTRPGSALWSCVCPAAIRGCIDMVDIVDMVEMVDIW